MEIIKELGKLAFFEMHGNYQFPVFMKYPSYPSFTSGLGFIARNKPFYEKILKGVLLKYD